MKKLRTLLLAICLVSALSLFTIGSTSVFADDGGPQGGSNSTKATPPPPPPQNQSLSLEEIARIMSAIMSVMRIT
jgi:hypothetical protein